MNNKLKIIRHPLDTPLTIACGVFTVFTYAFFTYMFTIGEKNQKIIAFLTDITGLDSGTIELTLNVGCDIIYIIIICIVIRIIYLNLIFLGKSVSYDLRLKDSKYTYLKRKYNEFKKKMGLKGDIEIFITKEKRKSSILTMPIKSMHAITLDYNTILECEKRKDYTYAEVDMAWKMANIVLKEYSLVTYILCFFGFFIAGLGDSTARAKTYSSDMLIMPLVGKERLIEAIFIYYYKSDLYNKKNVEKIIYNKIMKYGKQESLATFIENLFSPVPIPAYRLKAILDFPKKYGRVF